MSKWIVNDSLDETADIEKYVWSDHPESHETQHVILFENTAEIFPQTGIRSVIELKKQVQPANTIIADIITPNHISAIGVLTDLKDNWNMFWLNEKEVIGTKFTQRKSAIKFIESMILEEEWATKKKAKS
ncbi:7661_t:CDS:2 [Entrophospora sp. SA101]|nr:7661_t:CDS:2 [Entrophospora sp. SA101]